MATPRQPNIVLILTDHFRRDAIGAATPHLRRLAERGTLFHNAYCASPLCMPGRNALITGLYPSQNGVCGNMAEPIAEHLRTDTFMQHLRTAGYHTALIGKHHYIDDWGLGGDAIARDDANVAAYGFDHVWQVLSETAPAGRESDCRYTKHLRELGVYDRYLSAYRRDAWSCGPFPLVADQFDDAYIGRCGVEYVTQLPADQPFYLNLSFVGPHPPYWHPGELADDAPQMPPVIGAPDSAGTRERRAHYLARCILIDRWVGQLVAAIEQRGELASTVFIFTSDHGDMLGDYGIWDKRFMYEQSVGVPFLMCGPGIPRGERDTCRGDCRALISHLDIYPTVLDLAGVDYRPLVRRRAGRSILPVLAGERGAWRNAVFAELGTAVMVRTGGWKLVFDPEEGGVRFLYNLMTDALETTNLAGVAGYEAVTRDLLERALAHRIQLTQYTHAKEERRVQRVRIGGDF